MWIAYRPENRIESFRSVNATTRTEKPPTAKQPKPPPAITSSRDILAVFDPKTDELARVEQKTDFHYREGDRQAAADTATLDQQKNLMTLNGKARLEDTSGSTNADRILIDQKSGDFTAEGNVASTRQPDGNGKSSAMLTTDEVLLAQAQRMVSTGHGQDQKIHYEGKAGSPAMIRQGSNRVTADRLDIDRKRHVLEAHGKTVSQFVDKAKAKDDKGKTATNPYTIVTAPDLVYSDETRLAVYKGDVQLKRPGMTVNSHELQAYLKDANSDSSLDKAIADGAVTIVSNQLASAGKPARKRTSSSEHAEYYADDGKVVIEGGNPELVDTTKTEKATGQQMTWFANDNDLIIIAGEHPAESVIRKKK